MNKTITHLGTPGNGQFFKPQKGVTSVWLQVVWLRVAKTYLSSHHLGVFVISTRNTASFHFHNG